MKSKSHFALAAFLALLLCQPQAPSQESKPIVSPKEETTKARIKEVAGTAEFLRELPKHFARLVAVDKQAGQVTLQHEGEDQEKTWKLADDAEIKIHGFWGRLEDLTPGDRVWAWYGIDRNKKPLQVVMLADEISQQDINGTPAIVQDCDGKTLKVKDDKSPSRTLRLSRPVPLPTGTRIFLQTNGETARVLLSDLELEEARSRQKAIQRERWANQGLPGTVGFVHLFSGEMDLILDHETQRWARSLYPGDKVTLRADPPIAAVVKSVGTWRERTQLRLVAKNRDLAGIPSGSRIHLLRSVPPPEVDAAPLPPDLDRPRTTKQERIDWFLATIYCTCGVAGDRCTGHFYTLASCNPNACGMPNRMRRVLGEKIDQGFSDPEILETLLTEEGPILLKPHLLP